jgi:hypothetical protein
MPLMGYREYARHRKCELYSVQKAIEAGRIKTVVVENNGKPRKLIDSDQADRDWIRHTDPAKQRTEQPSLPGLAEPIHPPRRDAPPDTQSGAEVPDDPESDLKTPGEESDPGFREARTEHLQLKIQRERMELQRERGELLHVDDAARIAGTALRVLRDSLGNIGARISAQLASITDPVECESLLQEEIDAALRSVSVEALLVDTPDDDEEA